MNEFGCASCDICHAAISGGAVPEFAGDADWGLKLVYGGPVPLPKHF
jgi:hypothetical protein